MKQNSWKGLAVTLLLVPCLAHCSKPAPVPLPAETPAPIVPQAESTSPAIEPPPAAVEPKGILPFQFDRGGASQSATMFIPSQKDTARPLLLLLDPNGSAVGIVSRYAKAAEKAGWFLAASPRIRNGTADAADREELLAMLEYLKSKYNVDGNRVFLGGFSGGACGAYTHALGNPDLFQGAIIENGHMGPWRTLRDSASGSQRFYLFTRTGDFNAAPTRQLQTEMQAKGFTTQLMEDAGGHEPMSPDQVVQAIEWF